MTQAPGSPKLYHIVNVDRLSSIIEHGYIYSDAEMLRKGLGGTNIGISDLKAARLERPVKCWPGTTVGQYTPFYFCPRSVMLYLIHMRNGRLAYRGGQEPIVTLQVDLHAAVAWADEKEKRWAFCDANGNAKYANFYSDLSDLDELRWDHIGSSDFRDADVKDAKQSEFLVYKRFPWTLVERVGMMSQRVFHEATNVIRHADHQPPREIVRTWYY